MTAKLAAGPWTLPASCWDGHLLLRHRDDRELRLGTTSWITRGLSRGEQVLCASDHGDPGTAGGALEKLTSAGAPLRDAVRDGRLEMLDWSQVEDLPSWGRLADLAVARGFSGLRVFVRSLPEQLTAERLIALESHYDDLCRSAPLSVLCDQRVDRWSGRADPPGLDAAHLAVMDLDAYLTRSPGRVRVVGEIDLANAQTLRDVLLQAGSADPPGTLTVEAQDWTFVDTAGVRALKEVSTHLRSRGGDLAFIGLPHNVRRVMELVGFDPDQQPSASP